MYLYAGVWQFWLWTENCEDNGWGLKLLAAPPDAKDPSSLRDSASRGKSRDDGEP